MKRNFVVVASDPVVRDGLADLLRSRGWSVTRATSGAEAERIVRTVAVDALVLESHLSDMRPEQLVEMVRGTRPDCRIVVVTNFDQIRNTPEQLRYGSEHYVLGADEIVTLVEAPFAPAGSAVAGFAERGNAALIQVIDVLVGVLELEDRHFGGFSHQAARLAREIAAELGADEQGIDEVSIATLLRDVGKIAVEPDLLDERGWYSDEQRQRMKAHVQGTLKLFEHVDFPWKVAPILRHHHERYDGNGYPDGLRGRSIPLGARIAAVVDAYVALTSGRTHRGPFDPEQALTMIVGDTGRQFDPEVAEALQRVLDKRGGAPAEAARKASLLIVDAHDEFRSAVKMRLVNEGFTVSETETVEQALGLVLEDRPELVLIDVDAEPGQAFTLLQEMREDESLCRTPVAFLSRKKDRIQKLRALREGVDDYLDKDADLEELVARLQSILSREARRDGKARRVRRGIHGDLDNLPLADIVQTLSMGMKTARVTLISNKRRGNIWFENGAARHARCGDIEGEQAFYEMVRWSSGEFVIEHGVRSKDKTLRQDAMFLVMEGLRLMDESAGSAEAVS